MFTKCIYRKGQFPRNSVGLPGPRSSPGFRSGHWTLDGAAEQRRAMVRCSVGPRRLLVAPGNRRRGLGSKSATSDEVRITQNKMYDLAPISNPNTNYCFVKNSEWFAFLSAAEGFSCFSLQVSLWQGPSCSWSLRALSNGCCFLLPQKSFW